MNDPRTPLIGSLSDIKGMLEQLIKSIDAYRESQKSESEKRKDPIEVQAVTSLPAEVGEYYRSEQSERRANNIRENVRTVLEVVGVCAAIALAIFTYRTLQTFNGQLSEMQNQTSTLRQQAAQSAQDSKQQIELSRKQVAAAQDSVTAVQRQMRVDQRAWLEFEAQPDTPSGDRFTVKITEGQPINYPLRVVNIGKTPAKNIVTKVFVDVINSSQEPPLRRVEDAKTGSPYPFGLLTGGIVFPGTNFDQVVFRPAKGGGPLVATADEVNAMNQGKAYLAVYGVVTYDDIFQVHHWTKFCKWIPSADGTFSTRQCTAYNSVDKNK